MFFQANHFDAYGPHMGPFLLWFSQKNCARGRTSHMIKTFNASFVVLIRPCLTASPFSFVSTTKTIIQILFYSLFVYVSPVHVVILIVEIVLTRL